MNSSQDLDDLWTLVLSYFEKRAILSEEQGPVGPVGPVGPS